MLLNNQWIIDEIKEEIEKYLKTKENKGTKVQKLWLVAKADLAGMFIAIKSYFKKYDKSQINNLTFPQNNKTRRTNKP